jgi:adenine-specific DNA glycosylase
MLQQTQTERVTPKYAQWLERFPTIESAAEAPLADALVREGMLTVDGSGVYRVADK